MASPRVNGVLIAMYVTEALGCGAWIWGFATGPTPTKVLLALGLTVVTAILHLAAVIIDVEEQLRIVKGRILSRAGTRG